MSEHTTPAAPQSDGGKKPKRAAPVFVYLLVLFIAAFLMLLLAYCMQVRDGGTGTCVSRETVSVQLSAKENDHHA